MTILIIIKRNIINQRILRFKTTSIFFGIMGDIELINDLECAYELSDEELEDIDDGAEFR